MDESPLEETNLEAVDPQTEIRTIKDCSERASAFRKVLYDFFENPGSSVLSNIYMLVISALIFISVTSLTVQSLPSFQEQGEVKFVWFWMGLEGTIAAIFTIEYLIRFFVIVKSWKTLLQFCTSVWNFIDILSFLPFWVEMVLYIVFENKYNIEYLGILRTLRMFRIFSVWKTTKDVMILLRAFYRSGLILLSIVCIYGVMILIFSTVVYHFEKGTYDFQRKRMIDVNDNETKFGSIVETFWWSIVTLPTLGYGDMVPLTGLGRVFSSIFIILGLTIISLPSLVIGKQIEVIEKEIKTNDSKKRTTRAISSPEMSPLLPAGGSGGGGSEEINLKSTKELMKKLEENSRRIQIMMTENLEIQTLLNSRVQMDSNEIIEIS